MQDLLLKEYHCPFPFKEEAHTNFFAKAKTAPTSLGERVHSGLLSFCTTHSWLVTGSVFMTGSTGSAASLPASLAALSAASCFSFVASTSSTCLELLLSFHSLQLAEPSLLRQKLCFLTTLITAVSGQTQVGIKSADLTDTQIGDRRQQMCGLELWSWGQPGPQCFCLNTRSGPHPDRHSGRRSTQKSIPPGQQFKVQAACCLPCSRGILIKMLDQVGNL